MNSYQFADMIAAIRGDKKIEAIRLLREMITDHAEAFTDNTESRLMFCKQFIEALAPQISKEAPEASPTYRFGVVYRLYNGEHQYSSHLDLAEAQRDAEAMVSNPEFDLDYCHVVEIKQSSKAKTVYTMQPFAG